MVTKTILIADDEAHLRRMLGYSLKKAGYDVIESEDGKRALELVEQVGPDLIIADLMMPHVNGIDFVKRLRGMGPVGEIPFVLISAGRKLSDKILGFKAGADEFLNKPFPLDDLMGVVERLLSARSPSADLENGVGKYDRGGSANPGLGEILAISRRHERVFSLALVEIAHRVDDGTRQEEIVAVSIARTLTANIRKADLLNVYPGDLFSVVMPETPREGADIFVGRIRSELVDKDYLFKGKKLPVTVSVYAGTASFPDDGKEEGELLHIVKARMMADPTARVRVGD